MDSLATRMRWFFVRLVESQIDTLITNRIGLFYDNLVREGVIPEDGARSEFAQIDKISKLFDEVGLK